MTEGEIDTQVLFQQAGLGVPADVQRFLGHIAKQIATEVEQWVQRFPRLRGRDHSVHNSLHLRLTRMFQNNPPATLDHFWNRLRVQIPNFLRNLATAEGRHNHLPLDDDLGQLDVADRKAASPDELAEVNEAYAAIGLALGNLTPMRRDVFVLGAAGLSHAQIGEALGITAKASKMHLSRARADLKIALRPHVPDGA